MSDSAFNVDNLNLPQTLMEGEQWLEQETTRQQQIQQIQQGEQAEATQLAAEQEDPRNKENWGLDAVVEELQSAFAGGTQDTASSIATVGERIIDTATGEMQEEMGTEEGYKAEWDDWFVDDANPIETKTWWGGLIRSATHFGTLGGAIVLAAKAAGATGLVAGGAALVSRIPGGAAVVGGIKTTIANQWARAAVVGAGSDLVSKYSQDANGLQILRDRYGFIDTPITTNDYDHPVVKTFKNVVEGMGIGEIANGVFRVMGKAKNSIGDAIAKGDLRTKSVADQVISKGKEELAETPNQFRGHKNKPIANSWQGSPTSKDPAIDVRDSQKRTRTDWGAEEGSPGSVTTPIQLQRAVRSSGLSEETVTDIYKELVSEPRFQTEIANVKAGRSTMQEVWGDAVEQWQRTGLGRDAADLSPEEYLAEYFEGSHRYFENTPDEMIAWSSKNVVAADLLVGSLMREIRDLGLAGRELFEIADLGSVDGPAKALFDKLITATTEVKRSRLLQSEEFRNLGAGRDPKTAKRLQKRFINENLATQVGESIEGFRLALKIAGESSDDDLFKAIFETVSMNKEIHNLTDFDNWIRKKLVGGELNGTVKQGVLIKELQGVMINSILSGPKTPVRAIMGTSTATFLRPISTAVGAAIRFPFTGDGSTLRASLASMNAMKEAIPEAWQLFKTRLNSYWAGDIATVKSRFSEYTRGDEQWKLFGDWAENSPNATLGDQAAYRMANMARNLNDNKFLSYSTKIMAATDDTFGYILSRAKAKEKAVREALNNGNKGQFTEINPKILKEAEDRFLGEIIDGDGNILDSSVEFAKREVTLTTDLSGFSKGLNDIFNATPWAKPFFLFARTGVNGLALTAKHTPGFNFLVKEFNDIARATPDNLADVTKYGINNAEDLLNAKALQQGRLAIGGSVITMGGIHFLNGGLTGNGPTDRKKRQVWLDAGWVPRSINIGGVWVGYDSMEPFNQILSGIADIGDHMELMGEEWSENQLGKLALVLAQSASSKSYLQGLQQMVDLFAGKPGQHNRIIAGLLNNTVPLAGLRNEIGKLLNPHMRELGSGWGDSIRNRNLITESIAGDPLPVKYDMLNGKPLKEYDFPTRMWNMFIPISLNLDQGPGRKLLFDSGYDLRTSTYSAPDGTDLSESPGVRSLYQKAIGDQNLELKLNKLAKDPRVIASIEAMQEDLRAGRNYLDPMKAYLHNKLIRKIFVDAQRRAWAKVKQNNEAMKLIEEERIKKIQHNRRLQETSSVEAILQLNK